MRVAWILVFLVVLLASASADERRWREVRSFACQLQNLKLEEVKNAPFDLLVCDYSFHGDHKSELTPQQVASLQKKPDGQRRYVIAYLSIGEAEDYRFYWKGDFQSGSPRWLGQTNPQWPGNYAVNYWEPGWKKVVLEYLDRIIDAGFDGVFLDKVDAYELHPDRQGAKSEMSQLVQDIAHHARERAGSDFGVFPQNAEDLLVEVGYLDTITGVGREETYYGYPLDFQPSPKEWTSGLEARLRPLVKAGKLVLCIDYAAPGQQAETSIKRAKANGFLEYVADRPLAKLQVTVNAGAEVATTVSPTPRPTGLPPREQTSQPPSAMAPWVRWPLALLGALALLWLWSRKRG